MKTNVKFQNITGGGAEAERLRASAVADDKPRAPRGEGLPGAQGLPGDLTTASPGDHDHHPQRQVPGTAQQWLSTPEHRLPRSLGQQDRAHRLPERVGTLSDPCDHDRRHPHHGQTIRGALLEQPATKACAVLPHHLRVLAPQQHRLQVRRAAVVASQAIPKQRTACQSKTAAAQEDRGPHGLLLRFRGMSAEFLMCLALLVLEISFTCVGCNFGRRSSRWWRSASVGRERTMWRRR